MAASTTALSTAAGPAAADVGRIFIFCNVKTKQTIYSLTRNIKVEKALKQIPFMGKKTKDPFIRKDMWRPLAFVTFPNRHTCVQAYRSLREFQIRHQHEWSPAEVNPRREYDVRGMPKFDIYSAARNARNQKANTVADLAFILTLHHNKAIKHEWKTDKEQAAVETAKADGGARIAQLKFDMAQVRHAALAGDAAALARYKELKVEKMRIKRHMQLPRPDMAMESKYHPRNDRSNMPKFGVRKQMRLKARVPRFSHGVRVAWADKHDLEHAREWPPSIAHDQLVVSGSTLWSPAKPAVLDGEEPTAEETAVEAAAEPEAPQPPQSLLDRIIVRMRYGADGARPPDASTPVSASTGAAAPTPAASPAKPVYTFMSTGRTKLPTRKAKKAVKA